MKANLEIFHPGFKPKLLGFIASVMNSETIILARLNNGDVHMLGDNDRGAEIGDSVEATSGKAVTDNNGATLSFVYEPRPPKSTPGIWTPLSVSPPTLMRKKKPHRILFRIILN